MVSLENISIPPQRGSSPAMCVKGSVYAHTHTHTRAHIYPHPHPQADNLRVNLRVCASVKLRLCFCVCVRVCVSRPPIRQIMIHHDNGALMAAVKIIFNKPSLCLSLSLSLSHTHTHTLTHTRLTPHLYLPASHNPLCQSLNHNSSSQRTREPHAVHSRTHLSCRTTGPLYHYTYTNASPKHTLTHVT